MNQEIENLRKRIDEINDNILKLLSEREKICKEMGKIKKQNGLEVRNEKREQGIIFKLREGARELDLDEEYVEKLFRLMIENSRKIQEK